MSKKKNIFIIPRAGKLSKIRYHSVVCSYFLSKYLKKYYNIINGSEYIEDSSLKGTAETRGKAIENNMSISLSDLSKQDYKVDYILSTNQRGFTKLQKTRHKNKVNNIRKNKKQVKFISLHDHSAPQQYVEDILLVSLPFNEERRRILKKFNTELIYIGWCADHEVFKDKPKKRGDLNIVLDHAALQDFRADATDLYINQIKKLKNKYPKKKINLCRIKGGFQFFNFEKNKWTHNISFRWWDSKYDNEWENGKDGCTVFQIAECLNSSHIFCTTHVESCGLTGIEAFMAGCKVYIPKGKDTFTRWGKKKGQRIGTYEGPFLKQALLKPYMDYDIFEFNNPQQCFKLLNRDILNYNLKYNRKLLINNNSWKAAVDKIFKKLK